MTEAEWNRTGGKRRAPMSPLPLSFLVLFEEGEKPAIWDQTAMAEKHRRRSEVSFTKMGLSSSSCRPPRVIRVFHWQPIGPSPFPFTQAQSVLRLFSQGKRTHTYNLSLSYITPSTGAHIYPTTTRSVDSDSLFFFFEYSEASLPTSFSSPSSRFSVRWRTWSKSSIFLLSRVGSESPKPEEVMDHASEAHRTDLMTITRFVLNEQSKHPESRGDFTILLNHIVLGCKFVCSAVNKVLLSVTFFRLHTEFDYCLIPAFGTLLFIGFLLIFRSFSFLGFSLELNTEDDEERKILSWYIGNQRIGLLMIVSICWFESRGKLKFCLVILTFTGRTCKTRWTCWRDQCAGKWLVDSKGWVLFGCARYQTAWDFNSLR